MKIFHTVPDEKGNHLIQFDAGNDIVTICVETDLKRAKEAVKQLNAIVTEIAIEEHTKTTYTRLK